MELGIVKCVCVSVCDLIYSKWSMVGAIIITLLGEKYHKFSEPKTKLL